MDEIKDLELLSLDIKNKKIIKIQDLKSKKGLNSFPESLTDKSYKLYILKNDSGDFLYVGITRQSLKKRLSQGFKATGRNGYHGYKWKDLSDVILFVLTFKNFEEIALENIEAELVYLIREETGKWPLYQNEIHFNNDFDKGQEIAKKILEEIEDLFQKT